jgi:hypothetical protein
VIVAVVVVVVINIIIIINTTTTTTTTTATTGATQWAPKPGQNYFSGNWDDLLNEVLAKGSILSEIFFLHSNCIY